MTIEDHLNDPDFQKLPQAAQIEILKQADPDFANFVNSQSHTSTTEQPQKLSAGDRFLAGAGVQSPVDFTSGTKPGQMTDPYDSKEFQDPTNALKSVPLLGDAINVGGYLKDKVSKAFSAFQPGNNTRGQDLAESIPFAGDVAEKYNKGDTAGAMGNLAALLLPGALATMGEVTPGIAKKSMLNILAPGKLALADNPAKFNELAQFMLDNPEGGWSKVGLYKNQKGLANDMSSVLDKETPNLVNAANSAGQGVSLDKSYANLDDLRQQGVNKNFTTGKPNDFSENIVNPVDKVKQGLDQSGGRIINPGLPDMYPETDIENAINTKRQLDAKGDYNPTIISDPSIPFAAKANRGAANGLRSNLSDLATNLNQNDWVKANENVNKALGVKDQLADSIRGRTGEGSNLPQEVAGVGPWRALGRSFKDVWNTTPLQLALGHGSNMMTSVLPSPHQALMAQLAILGNQINRHDNGGR